MRPEQSNEAFEAWFDHACTRTAGRRVWHEDRARTRACWLAAWQQARRAQVAADADIAAKLYSLFGKRHAMRRAGVRIAQAIRQASRAYRGNS